jgi:2-dehydro-3-deoxygalactonokinase
VSFQTFMTGELFALLTTASVLKHSASGDDWEDAAFDAALSEALSKPERLAARLFNLRAADLLHGQEKGAARAALSGYLIGAELAAARAYWLGQNLAILGTGRQARAYQSGLTTQGVPAMLVDAKRATLAGLTAAHRKVKETL